MRGSGIVNKNNSYDINDIISFLKRKGYHTLMLLKNRCHTGYDDVNKRGDGDTH